MKSLPTELLKKYNVAGPRYTSYPTVPYWTVNPTTEQWIETLSNSLSENNEKKIGSAIYVHIPFCESLCTYCGCNTRITRNHNVGAPYVDTVIQEWNLYKQKLGLLSENAISLTELHLGGGTPTFLSPNEMSKLLEGIFKHTKLTKVHELSVEADPRVTTKEHLKVLSNYGFKRLSLGIQDFDPKVQEVVHRIQTESQVKNICDEARGLGFTSINYDLIYGLPFQTQNSIETTIQILQRQKPDRIAFYGFAHVPWIKPAHRRYTDDDIPNADIKRALYERGREMLRESGYEEIGMDHFALRTDSLWLASEKDHTLHRNFMGYTTRQVAPLFGLGVSAIGDSWRAFAQNEKVLETYQERVSKGEIPIHRGHILDEEDLIIRRHILNIMTKFETSWNDQESYTTYLESVPEKLKEFENDGLIKLENRKLFIKEEGRPFIRNICMAFDARLARLSPQTNLFSKTI